MLADTVQLVATRPLRRLAVEGLIYTVTGGEHARLSKGDRAKPKDCLHRVRAFVGAYTAGERHAAMRAVMKRRNAGAAGASCRSKPIRVSELTYKDLDRLVGGIGLPLAMLPTCVVQVGLADNDLRATALNLAIMRSIKV